MSETFMERILPGQTGVSSPLLTLKR
jgi:hypothetical protein